MAGMNELLYDFIFSKLNESWLVLFNKILVAKEGTIILDPGCLSYNTIT